MAVYFMQLGEAGPIKIGHAIDPYKRRSSLQTGSGVDIDILAVIDGGRAEEQIAHEQFSHLHIRGELFSPADELLEYIRSMPRREKPPPKPRGRPQINHEQTPARFPEGTKARMEAVLAEGEKISDILREAVERELKRRERIAR